MTEQNINYLFWYNFFFGIVNCVIAIVCLNHPNYKQIKILYLLGSWTLLLFSENPYMLNQKWDNIVESLKTSGWMPAVKV